MNWNPRRRHHAAKHHRRHDRRHRHNPDLGGITGLVRSPGTLIGEGLATVAGAYYSVQLPNMLNLGFAADSGIVGALMRAGVRGLAGGLLYTGARRFMPSFSSGVLAGAMAAAGGGFVLEVLGGSVILGQGSSAETALIPAGLAVGAAPAVSGYGAYTRPQLGAYRGNALGAYTGRLGAFSRAGALVPGRGAFGGFYGGGHGFFG